MRYNFYNLNVTICFKTHEISISLIQLGYNIYLYTFFQGVNRVINYKVVSTLEMAVSRSGIITCGASNTIHGIRNTNFKSQNFLVNEIADGFGIPDGEYIDGQKYKWVYENQDVKIKCLASIYSFSSVNWLLGSDFSELPYTMGKSSGS